MKTLERQLQGFLLRVRFGHSDIFALHTVYTTCGNLSMIFRIFKKFYSKIEKPEVHLIDRRQSLRYTFGFLFCRAKKNVLLYVLFGSVARSQEERSSFAGAGQRPNVCEYLFLAYLKQGKDAQRVPVGDPPLGRAR